MKNYINLLLLAHASFKQILIPFSKQSFENEMRKEESAREPIYLNLIAETLKKL